MVCHRPDVTSVRGHKNNNCDGTKNGEGKPIYNRYCSLSTLTQGADSAVIIQFYFLQATAKEALIILFESPPAIRPSILAIDVAYKISAFLNMLNATARNGSQSPRFFP